MIKVIYSHELTATSCLGILFCDPGCPFCPPGAFGNSNGDGEDDNTSSSTESSSQTAAATVELVATGVVDVFVTDLPALSDLTVSDALPSCHLVLTPLNSHSNPSKSQFGIPTTPTTYMEAPVPLPRLQLPRQHQAPRQFRRLPSVISGVSAPNQVFLRDVIFAFYLPLLSETV